MDIAEELFKMVLSLKGKETCECPFSLKIPLPFPHPPVPCLTSEEGLAKGKERTPPK